MICKLRSVKEHRRGLSLKTAPLQISLVKMSHTGLARALNLMAGVFIRERKTGRTDTQGRRPCEDGGRGWRVKMTKAKERQKRLATARSKEEAMGDSLPEAPEGARPCRHLEFALPASQTVRQIHFCGCKPRSLGSFVEAALGN